MAQTWNSRVRQRTIVVVVFIVSLLIALVSYLWHILHRQSSQVSCSTSSTQPGHTAFSNQSQGTHFKATTTVDPYSWGFSTELPVTETSPSTTGSQQPFKYNPFVFVFNLALLFLYLYLIPLPCLVVINIRFLRGLRHFQKRRKRFAQTQMDFTSSKQVRVILNVAVILAVFLVCQAASLAIWITFLYRRISPHEYDICEPQSNMLANIGWSFTALNSAVNFWVYLAFLKDFRLAMARMVARICHCCSCTQEN